MGLMLQAVAVQVSHVLVGTRAWGRAARCSPLLLVVLAVGSRSKRRS
jgi:hypothetical protein